MNARSFQAVVQAAGNRSTVVIVDQFCEHQSLVSAVETVKVQRKGLVNLCKVECFQAIVQAAGNRSTVVIVDQFCEHQSPVSAVETG
jgi:hypothetical protein